MPLSSSLHDYGVPRSKASVYVPFSTASAAAGLSRFSVQYTHGNPANRSYGRATAFSSPRQHRHQERQQMQPDTAAAPKIVMGTASLASTRERETARPLTLQDLSTSSSSVAFTSHPSQLASAPENPKAASTTTPSRRGRATSLDGRYSIGRSSRQVRPSTQPLIAPPSNAGFASATSVNGSIPRRPGTSNTPATKVPLAPQETASKPAAASAASPSAAREVAIVTAPSVTAAAAAAAALASAAAPLVHLRPLSTSREADYFNFAPQRAFAGRYRCAATVVVRTSPSATSHVEARRATEATSTSKDDKDAANREEKNHSSRSSSSAPKHHEESETPTPAVAVTSTTAAAAPTRRPMPSRPRLTRPSSGSPTSSVISGAASLRDPGTRLRSSAASLGAPSSSARSTMRPSATGVVGLGEGKATAGVPAANMEPLAQSGLHTALWLAVQDGGLEVRSMADLSKVLASLPRRDPRAVVTTLAAVCKNRVVAGYTDGSLHVFDATTMSDIMEHHPHTSAVTCLLYVDSAPRLHPVGNAPADAATRHELHSTHTVSTAAAATGTTSATASLLLTGSLDRSITVWEAATMTLLHRLKGSLTGVSALAATVTGGYAFSGADDGTIRMWDVAHGLQLAVTKDERAKLAKRAQESAAVRGGGNDSATPRGVSRRLVGNAAATETNSDGEDNGEENDDGGASGSSSDRTSSNSSTVGSVDSGDRVSRHVSHRMPRINGETAPSLHHLTAPHAATARGPTSTRRTMSSYGGIKANPPFHGSSRKDARVSGVRGPIILHGASPTAASLSPPHRSRHALTCRDVSPVPSLPGTAATDDGFAPTETNTTFSAFRDGSNTVLAGPDGGISPIGSAMTYGDDFQHPHDENAAGVVCGSSPPTQKRRKKVRKTTASGGGPVTEMGGNRKKGKGKSAGAGAGTRHKMKKAKRSSTAPGGNGSSAALTTAGHARLPTSALEQQLESWLSLYQRRVLFSAASAELALHISAGYTAVRAVNWPIEYAHSEYVTGLTVMEDRLLVSVSSDASAKVFALPSGQFVRTLLSSRRMPLSGVLYDAAVRRVYTAFSDGGVAAYDVGSPELSLLTLLQPTRPILSCTFVPVAATSMRRFVLLAEGADYASSIEGERQESKGDSVGDDLGGAALAHTNTLTTVALFDKTTQAHGPNQTTSSYRVGQPSLRELNAAVSMQPLQQQRAAAVMAQLHRPSEEVLERRQQMKQRKCAAVMEQEQVSRLRTSALLRWRRWAERRVRRRTQLAPLAQNLYESAVQLLSCRYMREWWAWARERSRSTASAVLRTVQLQGSDATLLHVPTAVRQARQRSRTVLTAALTRTHTHAALRSAFQQWREFQRIRQAAFSQAVAYNKLYLSMKASADSPTCTTLVHMTRTARRQANHAQALRVLSTLAPRWQSHTRRAHAFTVWRRLADARRQQQKRQQQQQQRSAAEANYQQMWSLVEPLSSVLVRPQLLRRRCFALWHDFALYVGRRGRLTSERDTLQDEWQSVQETLKITATLAELQAQVKAAEAAIAAAASASVTLRERAQLLASEEATLRSQGALRVLIGGYNMPNFAVSMTATATSSTSASVTPTLRSGVTPRSLNRRSLKSNAAVTSVEQGNGVRASTTEAPSAFAATADEESLQRQSEDLDLLFEVSAVLRALKGNAMQCARDDRLLAKAHALALGLPIHEPSWHAGSGSTATAITSEASSVRRGQPQRSPMWSVSSASNGGSAAVGMHAPTTTPRKTGQLPPQSHPPQQRFSSTMSASFSSTTSTTAQVHSNTAAAATTVTTPNMTPRMSSAAQMWAAQPAEETYACLANAFDAIFGRLIELLYASAKETDSGAVPSTSSRFSVLQAHDKETDTTSERAAANGTGSSWLAQLPLKQRRVMVGEVLKLVTLFDSFMAHSDLPVERAGSISTRGAAKTRALPLCSLCRRDTAQALLRHAAALLELVDPQLWPRQVQLNYLQDAYAAAIAELNVTVMSSVSTGPATVLEDDLPRAVPSIRAPSETVDGARNAASPSPPPPPLAIRLPALCLSAEVLERAGDQLRLSAQRAPASSAAALHDAHALPLTNESKRGVSAEQSTGRRSSAERSVDHVRPASLASNLDPYDAHRHFIQEGKLNDTMKSVDEEGQTPTPELAHGHSCSFSHRTFSGVSTPRSYTPRTATSSVACISNQSLQKPYLGFRVNVLRDPRTTRRADTIICIREVTAQYVNADGAVVDGPALVAGLQVGDQLVRFAGYAVTDLAAFNAVVSRHVHSRAALPVVVQRNGEQWSTSIVVGTRST